MMLMRTLMAQDLLGDASDLTLYSSLLPYLNTSWSPMEGNTQGTKAKHAYKAEKGP